MSDQTRNVPTIRLSKFIASAGVCSRRQASRLIESGVVLVNGRLGVHTDQVSQQDLVFVEGKQIRHNPPRLYFIYNKPIGIDSVCNTKDPNSIVHTLASISDDQRIFPVGRLDKDSHGLLLLTNDGELCQRLMHPDFYHEKEYRVTVDKVISEDFLEAMNSGVDYRSQRARPCKITQVNAYQFDITLTQGMNRQIWRMCQALSYRVKDLFRFRILGIQIKGLNSGACRALSENEVVKLYSEARASRYAGTHHK